VQNNSENQIVPRRLFKPKNKGFPDMNCFALSLYNKTLTQTPNGESPKTTFRKGAESGFRLWQELKNVQQKMTALPSNLEKIRVLVSFYAHARTYFSTKCQK
jgi:hypothetical protein